MTSVLVCATLARAEPVVRQDVLLIWAALFFFFIVINNIGHGIQGTILLWVTVAFGTATAAVAAWQTVKGGAVASLRGGGLAFWRGDSVHAVSYLLLVFPLAAAQALFSRRSFAGRVTLLLASVVMIAVLALCFDRAGWLGCLAALVVLGVYMAKRQAGKRRLAILGAVVATAAIAGSMLVLRFVTGSRLPVTDLHGNRWASWHSALLIGLDHRWLGGGPGMFSWLFPAHRTLQLTPDVVGNEYLHIFAEYGVLGCLLLGWAAVGFILYTRKALADHETRRSVDTPSNRYANGVAGMALMITVLVAALFECAIHPPVILFTFATIMAIVMARTGRRRDSNNSEKTDSGSGFGLSRTTRYMLAVGLIVVVIMFGMRIAKNYPAQLAFRQAEQERARLNWAAAEAGYKLAWDKDNANFMVAEALGDLYAARATWNPKQREENIKLAIEWYENALNTNRYDYDALIKIARLHDALRNRQKAEDFYTRAILADPDNSAYHTQLGLHYQRWKDVDNAVASFQQARQLGATDPVPEVQLKHLGKNNDT